MADVKVTKLTDAEKRRRLIWVVWASMLNSAFCVLTFVGTVFILFLNQLGFSKVQIGFLVALVPLCQVVALPAARPLERMGFKKAYLLFLGIRKVVFSLMLLTPLMIGWFGDKGAFWWVTGVLGVFAVVRSLGETAIWPWSEEFIPNRIRGKFSAVNTIVATLAVMVAVSGAGWVIGRYEGLRPFMMLFVAATGVGILAWLCYTRVPGGAPKDRDGMRVGVWQALKETGRDVNFVRFLAGLGLVTLGLTSVFAFVPLYMREKVGLDARYVVWLELAFLSGSLLTCYLWGWASDRFGSKPVVLTTVGIACVLPVLWFLMPRQSGWSLYAAGGIALIAGTANIGWLVSSNRYLFVGAVPPEKKSTYLAVFFAWGGIVGGGGPLLAGWLLETCAGLELRWWWLRVDAYGVLFGAALAALGLGWAAMSRLRRDGEIATPTFVGMFLHGNTILAFSTMLRHRWARDEMHRILTTGKLGRARTLLNVPELVVALNDPSFNVRYEAIIALANMPAHAKVIDELILVLGGEEPELSLAAAWALGRLGERSAILPLRETLMSDYPLLRARSARSLAMLKDTYSCSFILEQLKQETDVGIQVAYASALGSLREKAALGEVLRLLGAAEDDPSREELALATARLVSTEPHYIRLRRRLWEDTATQAAEVVMHFKRALVFEHEDIERLRHKIEACSHTFAADEKEEAVGMLVEIGEDLPWEKVEGLYREVFEACREGLAKHGVGRFEYVVLLMYLCGRVLRELHDQVRPRKGRRNGNGKNGKGSRNQGTWGDENGERRGL